MRPTTIVPTQELRYTHVAFMLVLSFLLFPLAARFRNRIALVGCVPGIARGRDHRLCAVRRRGFYRPRHRARPLGCRPRHHLHRAGAGSDAAHHRRDHAGGRAPVHRLRDARAVSCRRRGRTAATTSRAWSATCSSRWKAFSASPVDVSATLIILFTIYGAFLQHSGAGKFFIDFSLALMGGKPNSAGRTVVLSSFLLGGPSGSGVATTVMIGTVAYPMLQRQASKRTPPADCSPPAGLARSCRRRCSARPPS